MSSNEVTLGKRGAFEKFIHAIEVIGNKFPHPVWLFVVLSVILLALSSWLAGTQVTYMVSKSGKIEAQTALTYASNPESMKRSMGI